MNQPQARVQEHENGKAHGAERERDKERSGHGKACPHCGASNPEEAAFCGECGTAFPGVGCPKCGKPTSPGADICVHCGAWLLTSQCKFCYAELPDGADFCPECGLPQAGIVCAKCGTTSAFDFCSKCNNPLTEQARVLVAEAEHDPEFRTVLEAVRESAKLDQEIARLDAELAASGQEDSSGGEAADGAVSAKVTEAAVSAKAEEAASRRRGMSATLKNELLGFSAPVAGAEPQRIDAATKAAIEAALEHKDGAEEQRERRERQQEELRRKKAELEAQKRKAEDQLRVVDTLASFKTRTFLTNQSARRFHMAHKPANPIGWLCNYANVVHPVPEGPNACQCPGQGGYWIMDK
jgi:hypothetical protein